MEHESEIKDENVLVYVKTEGDTYVVLPGLIVEIVYPTT